MASGAASPGLGADRLDVDADVPPRSMGVQTKVASVRPGGRMDLAERHSWPGATLQRLACRFADHVFQRPPERIAGRTTQDRGEVRAGMRYQTSVGHRRKHRAMRLDRAGNVDRLALAERCVSRRRLGLGVGLLAAARHGRQSPRGKAGIGGQRFHRIRLPTAACRNDDGWSMLRLPFLRAVDFAVRPTSINTSLVNRPPLVAMQPAMRGVFDSSASAAKVRRLIASSRPGRVRRAASRSDSLIRYGGPMPAA